MNEATLNRGKTRSGHLPAKLPVAVAVACVLAQSAAMAQNIPNQSGMRAEFNRSFGNQELPPGLTVEPRVDWAVQYANNTNLASSNGDSSAGVELSPGAYVAYNSDRFRGAVDYSLIGRLWDDGTLQDVTHDLAANGRWNAIPELFSISGDASYGDTLIDLQEGGNYGNLGVFNSGNIAERATASVRPALEKRFKDFEFRAAYSYGQVWYFDQGEGDPNSQFFTVTQEDSTNQTADVSLALVPGQRRYWGKIFYEWNRSDFDLSIPYQFERAGLDVGRELSRTLSFVGDVGLESALDEDTSAGGLDSEFWSAGLRWEETGRTSLEARYGERFFGSSYSASFTHTARLLRFNASYSEEPDVDNRRINLGAFEPGELPPWFDPNADAGQYNSQPFVGENAHVGVTAEGNRTTLAVRAFDTNRDYLNELLGDEHDTGVAIIGSRRLAVNASVDARVSYADRERDATFFVLGDPIPASHTYRTELTLTANRDFGPRVILSAEAGYFNSAGTEDYDGWWVGVRGRWLPDIGR